MSSRSFVIGSRYCGPPSSANGGYAAGALASFIEGDAVCTLRKPPPLDRPIDVREDGAVVIAEVEGERIAEAEPAALEMAVPAIPTWDQALAAEGTLPWRHDHVFPTCFVCGSKRTPGDGLRIFPGAVDGLDVAAATWRPHAALADEDGVVSRAVVWAALDCPSVFGAVVSSPELDRPALLGRLAVRIEQAPRVGERWIAMGWLERAEGRKIHAGSALVRDDGCVGSVAASTWIILKSA